MNTPPALDIIGVPASPYTRKMVAIARYRRIAHRLHWGDPSAFLEERGLPRPKVALLPTVVLNTGDEPEILIDSTPIARRLDRLFSRRKLRPSQSPALAMIDSLVEDFGDEWLTKLMFHFRWSFQQDIDFSASTLPLGQYPALKPAEAAERGKVFAERQIDRLRYVGSNPQTAPTIEKAYRRLLGVLDRLLEQRRFILGGRPGAGDFALYAQLTQLALYDPTPRSIAAEVAPRVVAWTSTMEDLSGLDISLSLWEQPDALKDSLHPLLSEIGRVYVPVLLANAKAVAEGLPHWEAEVDGALWAQDTFPYQAKCLTALREEYDRLEPDERATVQSLLADTGCQSLFS